MRVVSFEPLIGPLKQLDLSNIDWVIVGGESGPGARPMEPEWVFDILKHCRKCNVPFFFKQWGGKNRKIAGRQINGKIYDEMPHEMEKHKAF